MDNYPSLLEHCAALKGRRLITGKEIMRIKRVIIIVLDSLGIGALPDAGDFNDEGANTLASLAAAAGGRLELENLARLGLGHIEGVFSVGRVPKPAASFGRMMEASRAKDTVSGQLEMAGVIAEKPLATFPDGFPPEIMNEFSRRTGLGYLWGKPASGTEIIELLGHEHMLTGKPIIYTSADSVFQVAAHEDIIALERLYEICAASRAFLDDFNVGRVIARPFQGPPGVFKRTAGRRDFALEPTGETVLEGLTGKKIPVVGIGKIGDIFSHRGLSKEVHTSGNEQGMQKTAEALCETREGLIFTNLVDFDMLYGHRNDPGGYLEALKGFDRWLPGFLSALGPSDMLIITADHGCDPAFSGTDHTREYVPLLVYGSALGRGRPLGTRASFADIGATLSEVFGLAAPRSGTSFLGEVGPIEGT